jgi:hypothetical protein
MIHTRVFLNNGEVRGNASDARSEGCPEWIIRSVNNKNAGLAAVRAAEKRMGVRRAETRMRTRSDYDRLVEMSGGVAEAERRITQYISHKREAMALPSSDLIAARDRRLQTLKAILSL